MWRKNFLRLLVLVSVVLGLFVVLSLVLGMAGLAQDVHTQNATVELDGPVYTNTLPYGTTGNTAIGVPCATGTGGYRLMMVSVYWQCVQGVRNITGVTLTTSSGTTYPLNLLVMVDNYPTPSGGFGRREAVYWLVGPPYNASGYVTATFSGNVQYGVVAAVANFKGVDQSTPLGTYATALYTDTVSTSTDIVTTHTLTVATTAGDLVYDSVALFGNPPVGFITATVGQTELWNVLRDRLTTNGVRVRGAASTKTAVDATTVMTWTASGIPGGSTTARPWAMIGVPIKASPTAARLNSLTAGANHGTVRVTWETASDVDSVGFHVYRATSVDGQRERLTTDLIPSQAPGSVSGSRYQFVDETAQPGLTYYYWLELIGVDGAMELHGPVSARVSFNLRLLPPRQ